MAEMRGERSAGEHQPVTLPARTVPPASRVRTTTQERVREDVEVRAYDHRALPPPTFDARVQAALQPLALTLAQLTTQVGMLVDRVGEGTANGLEAAHAFNEQTDAIANAFGRQSENLDAFARATMGTLGEVKSLLPDIRRLERAVAGQAELLGKFTEAIAANTAAKQETNALIRAHGWGLAAALRFMRDPHTAAGGFIACVVAALFYCIVAAVNH